jgi:hypothetical protein
MDHVNRGILGTQIVGYKCIEAQNQENNSENPGEIEAEGVLEMEHLASPSLTLGGELRLLWERLGHRTGCVGGRAGSKFATKPNGCIGPIFPLPFILVVCTFLLPKYLFFLSKNLLKYLQI